MSFEFDNSDTQYIPPCLLQWQIHTPDGSTGVVGAEEVVYTDAGFVNFLDGGEVTATLAPHQWRSVNILNGSTLRVLGGLHWHEYK